MRIKLLTGIVCGVLVFTANALACPLTIHNDAKSSIFVLDAYNKNAVQIDSGQSQIIDPTVHDFTRYLRSEKLDFYALKKPSTSSYYRKYQLVEKYCSDEGNQLSTSDVQKLVKNPTKRFSVKEFAPRAVIPHAQTGHKH